MAIEDVRFEDIKTHQICVGYVHVLLTDEGEPVATHRLFPPTEEGKQQAMRHAAQTCPSRKPAVIALRLNTGNV